MVRLEKINLCLRESLKERIWVSVSVRESTGVDRTLHRLQAGDIHLTLVSRCRIIMISSHRLALVLIILIQKTLLALRV